MMVFSSLPPYLDLVTRQQRRRKTDLKRSTKHIMFIQELECHGRPYTRARRAVIINK